MISLYQLTIAFGLGGFIIVVIIIGIYIYFVSKWTIH